MRNRKIIKCSDNRQIRSRGFCRALSQAAAFSTVAIYSIRSNVRWAANDVIKIFINLHSFNGYGLRCPCFLHAHNFRLLNWIYFASHLPLHFEINHQSGKHFQFGLFVVSKIFANMLRKIAVCESILKNTVLSISNRIEHFKNFLLGGFVVDGETKRCHSLCTLNWTRFELMDLDSGQCAAAPEPFERLLCDAHRLHRFRFPIPVTDVRLTDEWMHQKLRTSRVRLCRM